MKRDNVKNTVVSDGQIQAWKQKFGGVYSITVEDVEEKFGDLDAKPDTEPEKEEDKTEYVGYFRKPNLKIIAASSRFVSENPVKAGEILFDNCWLGGDEEIRLNDEFKLTAITKLNELFKVRNAQIKKL